MPIALALRAFALEKPAYASMVRRTLALLAAGIGLGNLWGCPQAPRAAVVSAPAASSSLAASVGVSAPASVTPITADRLEMPVREGMIRLSGGPFVTEDGRSITVASFDLDRTEVTTEAFAACVSKGGCYKPRIWSHDRPECNWGSDRSQHPVNCVTYDNAASYCGFVQARLPTDEEWEFAAHGGIQQRVYPWGATTPGPALLNACGTECSKNKSERFFEGDDDYPLTAPVGSFVQGASKEGVFDLAGNVAEWVSGQWSEQLTPPYVEAFAYRGGSWATHDWQVRGFARRAFESLCIRGDKFQPTRCWDSPLEFSDVGFRCARSIDVSPHVSR